MNHSSTSPTNLDPTAPNLAAPDPAAPDLTVPDPATFDLATFDLKDMIECGRAVRHVARNASTMEAAARRIVSWFHSHLVDSRTAQRNCVLVRCFKTHRFAQLPNDLAPIAAQALAPELRAAIPSDLPVLTLLATAGEQPQWNDRRASRGHAAIPLESVSFVERAPMIAALLRQMGVNIQAALYPDAEFILDSEQRSFNVFHVEHAPYDPRIPAQDQFVHPHGIRSVLGFGGLLPSGELFAVIIFSRTVIPRDTADLFQTIALCVKLALLPYTRLPRFDSQLAESGPPPAGAAIRAPGTPLGESEEEQLRSEIATLQLLIPALEDAALHQTRRLQSAYSDLQRQEEQVRQQERKLSAMLQATSDAVFLLDRQWRFTFLNQRAITLIASGRDLLYTTMFESFPAEATSSFFAHYRRAMDERIEVHFQEYYPAPLDKWFEVHASPTADGIAVFFRDITERLQTEATLRQAEKLAATGRMAASIAHEINNPLEAITNLLYLLAADPDLNSDSRSYVRDAESELRRVSEITTHMLRFYRQSTRPQDVDLHEVLDSVLVLFQGRLNRAGVLVEKRFAPAALFGFAGELRQIFANLVGNALDASSSGGRICLRVRPASHATSGAPGVRVTIADTGTGISPAARQHLFEPFFTTKGITGTGLGLWITLELVRKHHGSIRIRSSASEPNRGTVFSLFFPAQTAPTA